MKKMLAALFTLAIALVFTNTAFAADANSYRVPEMDMSIEIPSSLYAFTPETSIDDPSFRAVGVSKSVILTLFDDDSYMVILPADFGHEIIISQREYADPDDGYDFNTLSDFELQAVGESFEHDTDEDGTSCRYEIYDIAQTRFLKLIDENLGNAVTITYLTILNGKWITFMLFPGDDYISDQMDIYLEDIIDSAAFDFASPFFKISDTPIEHTDANSEISYTLPAGWGESLSKEKNVVARYKDNAGNSIYYYYEAYDIEKEKGRAEFTEADVRDLCNFSEYRIVSVEHETINHIDYFKVSQSSLSKSTGIISYVLYYDKCIYEFDFKGYTYSDSADNFSAIVASAKYGKIKNIGLKNFIGLPILADRSQIIVLVALSLLLALIIYCLPTLVYRYAVKKAPIPRDRALKLTIYYCGAFFILTLALSLFGIINKVPAIAVLLWSFINYLILKGGKAKLVPDYSYVNATPAYTFSNANTANVHPGANQNYAFSEYNPNNAFTSANPYSYPTAATGNCVSAESAQIPTPAVEQVPELKASQFCRICGASLSQGSVFCSSCGTKV